MSVPGPVQSALGDEDVAATVALKGDDALYVTPTRTLVYRAEGLLSDESVEEFPHDAERVEVDAGRRKTKIRLDYGLDGERAFAVPTANLEMALHPVLAGVLSASGVTGAGETVTRTYRFSELTLVITSERIVKHVGEAVFDTDYEEIDFADVTGLGVEEGSVATQLVIETADRPRRIKVPNEQARDVRERVEESLLAFHDAATYEEFRELVGTDADDGPGGDGGPGTGDDEPASGVGDGEPDFGSSLDPIEMSAGDGDAGPASGSPGDEGAVESQAGTAPGSDEPIPESGGGQVAAAEPANDRTGNASGFEEFETAVAAQDVGEELAALRRTVERQQRLLDEQQELLEQLIDTLDES